VRTPCKTLGPAIVAITPPSDIVLDVARAADPDRYRAAVERLARLRSTAEASAPPAAEFTVPPPPASPRPDASVHAQPRRQLDAYGQFEAFVLQSFLQSMLPHNATNVFGKGTAGEFWRSMLAERMGEELARSGQVGIARRLAAGLNHPAQPTSNPAETPLTLSPPLQSTLNHVQPSAAIAAQVGAPVVPAPPSADERS
jgi:peptidoglycan hydrolase FlgJ